MENLALAAGVMLVLLFIAIPIMVFYIIAMWKIYRKAGYEGWECIVPIYNLIIFLRMVGKPWWWLLLMCIPVVNIIFTVWAYNMLSRSFGKDSAFTVGLVLLGFIFIPILAFGSATYQGPFGDPAAFRAYRANKQGFDFEKNNFEGQS